MNTAPVDFMEEGDGKMAGYCHVCGTELVGKPLDDEGIVPFCTKCNQYRFPLYNVAVSMIVVNRKNGKILLIKQYGKPDYILVAGYVNRTENLESAVRREVKEETGMIVSFIRFNRTRFFEPSNSLMCNFTAFVDDDSGFDPNWEINESKWFSPEEARKNIKPNSLALYFLSSYLDETDAEQEE